MSCVVCHYVRSMKVLVHTAQNTYLIWHTRISCTTLQALCPCPSRDELCFAFGWHGMYCERAVKTWPLRYLTATTERVYVNVRAGNENMICQARRSNHCEGLLIPTRRPYPLRTSGILCLGDVTHSTRGWWGRGGGCKNSAATMSYKTKQNGLIWRLSHG